MFSIYSLLLQEGLRRQMQTTITSKSGNQRGFFVCFSFVWLIDFSFVFVLWKNKNVIFLVHRLARWSQDRNSPYIMAAGHISLKKKKWLSQILDLPWKVIVMSRYQGYLHIQVAFQMTFSSMNWSGRRDILREWNIL